MMTYFNDKPLTFEKYKYLIAETKKIDILVLLKYLKLVPPDSNKLIRFKCLFHKDSKSGISCKINQNNKCFCYGCNKSFDVIDVYTKVKNLSKRLSFNTALIELYKIRNSNEFQKIKQIPTTKIKTVKLINPFSSSISTPDLNLLKNYIFIFDKITNFYHYELLKNKSMLNYLFKIRKLNLETIKQFKIGFSDDKNKLLKHFLNDKSFLLKLNLINYNEKLKFYSDTFKDCLIIPVLQNGHTKHIYGNNFKTITGFNPKYKALKKSLDIDYLELPYGFSFSKNEIIKQKKVILHEGFFDTIKAHQHGFKNVVSVIIIKNFLSRRFISFLKEYNIKVIIALDNDESGRANEIRLQEQLNKENIKNEVKHIKQKEFKDADDILKKNLQIYIKTYLRN
jgi:DNA primase